MRISFDLDDTLICGEQVPCEPNRIPFFFNPWINEPLRLGSRKLMKQYWNLEVLEAVVHQLNP